MRGVVLSALILLHLLLPFPVVADVLKLVDGPALTGQAIAVRPGAVEGETIDFVVFRLPSATAKVPVSRIESLVDDSGEPIDLGALPRQKQAAQSVNPGDTHAEQKGQSPEESEKTNAEPPSDSETPRAERRDDGRWKSLEAEVAASDYVLRLSNGDSYTWYKTEVEINSGLLRGGYKKHVGTLQPGQSVTLRLVDFTKGAERFEPSRFVIEKVSVRAYPPGAKDEFDFASWHWDRRYQ